MKKKHFNKELAMTEKGNEDFENSIIIILMVMLRDHCHITGNYRGSAHRDRDINVKLNPNCIN